MAFSNAGMGVNIDNRINVGNSFLSSMGYTVRHSLFSRAGSGAGG
jgi:hypothetical protein